MLHCASHRCTLVYEKISYTRPYIVISKRTWEKQVYVWWSAVLLLMLCCYNECLASSGLELLSQHMGNKGIFTLKEPLNHTNFTLNTHYLSNIWVWQDLLCFWKVFYAHQLIWLKYNENSIFSYFKITVIWFLSWILRSHNSSLQSHDSSEIIIILLVSAKEKNLSLSMLTVVFIFLWKTWYIFSAFFLMNRKFRTAFMRYYKGHFWSI